MDIEKELFPESGELKMVGETLCVQIIDEELDPIDCEFHYDRCIHIKTEGYTHLTLSIDNLYDMIDFIEQAEAKYKQIFKDEKKAKLKADRQK